MKTVVIYNSQTGFTKRYAEWISESINADCFEFNVAKKMIFDDYDTIIFGGWICAGTISKINWFKNKLKKWNNKKLIVFCVGGRPIEDFEVESTLKKVFSEEESKKVKFFYCPGGFNYEKMKTPSKIMMKLFIKALKSTKNKTESDEKMLEYISNSYDNSNQKYIEPILQYLNS